MITTVLTKLLLTIPYLNLKFFILGYHTLFVDFWADYECPRLPSQEL